MPRWRHAPVEAEPTAYATEDWYCSCCFLQRRSASAVVAASAHVQTHERQFQAGPICHHDKAKF